jgi:DNA polymerase III delta prime subunit
MAHDKIYELWINDKRPTDLDDIIGNTFFIKTIKNCIKHGRMPNLLLSGPEGIGKKMIAKLIAKKYGGDFKVIDATLNKSKDIVVVNMKNKTAYDSINITTFAQAKNKVEFGDKLKVIIITSFDEMTIEAQNALRSIIETYSKTTRFIITTTKIDDIIQPLQSRFNTFIIKKLSDKKIKQIVSKIMPCELLDLILLITEGDIRQVLNYLQLMDGNISISAFNIPDIIIVTSLIHEIYINKDSLEAFKILKHLIDNYDPQMIILVFNKLLIKLCYNIEDIYYATKLVLKRLEPRVHFITLINKLIINNINVK